MRPDRSDYVTNSHLISFRTLLRMRRTSVLTVAIESNKASESTEGRDNMIQNTTELANEYPHIRKLSESQRHSLLAADRRRVILDVLAERTTPIGLEDLAAAVAARQSDSEAPAKKTVARTSISLHHNHLPKMDDLGVIEYRADSKRIE